jgi:pimeloyl-ACP methyl ester carboxylesterase
MPFFSSNDQTQLFYQDYGTGHPLVFLSAWAMNSTMWEYQMLSFNDLSYRCLAYDRRGHGRSDRPAEGYHLDQLADDLEALLEHLDLRNAILVGISMGGSEIIRYLSRHGTRRISRIVLIAAMSPFLLKTDDNPEGVEEVYFEQIRTILQKDFPQWLADGADAFYRPEVLGVSPGIVQWTINMMLQTSLHAAIETQRLNTCTDFRSELPAITVPALVIHGDADQSIPVQFGRRTAELIPGCQYHEYTGAPHGLFFTHIDRLTTDITAFIEPQPIHTKNQAS